MKATYYVPGAEPKTYEAKAGEKPGTVDLLNAKGRVIVQGLPVAEGEKVSPRAYAVIVAGDSREKPSRPRPVKEVKPKENLVEAEPLTTTATMTDEPGE